jgi:hypothetical protein
MTGQDGGLLDPQPGNVVRLAPDETPHLMVVVDMEAEFDWSGPLSRSATSVKSVRCEINSQRIFERYFIRPVYVVDYAVASQADGYEPLTELLADERCIIGAHLQPWANPPFLEDVSNRRNSYAGNLSPELERDKLASLISMIERNFRVRPTVYRAGRFGVGPATADNLAHFGFEIDTSVVPYSDFSGEEDGPDFSRCGIDPYWFGPDDGLLEIPLTVDYAGALSGLGPRLYRKLSQGRQRALHMPGVMARLRLLDRVRLSPEGIEFEEMRRLTRTLLRKGQRLFNFTYHSPSFQAGNTPFVRNSAELQKFIDKIERYFDFFFGEVGGRATTPEEIKAKLARPGTAAVRQAETRSPAYGLAR